MRERKEINKKRKLCCIFMLLDQIPGKFGYVDY